MKKDIAHVRPIERSAGKTDSYCCIVTDESLQWRLALMGMIVNIRSFQETWFRSGKIPLPAYVTNLVLFW
jgi:hypothetical protein